MQVKLELKLTSQIELLPSCSINNNVVENNAANLNFGTIDFGEATGFKGVLEASLVNNGNSGFKIECAGISTVKIIFGQEIMIVIFNCFTKLLSCI